MKRDQTSGRNAEPHEIEYLPAVLHPIGLLEVVPQQHLTLRIRHRTFFALKFHAIRAIFGAVTCNNDLDSRLERIFVVTAST